MYTEGNLHFRLQECPLCSLIWDEYWSSISDFHHICEDISSNNSQLLSRCLFRPYLVKAIELLCPNAKTRFQNGKSGLEVWGGWARGILRIHCCLEAPNCEGFDLLNPQGGEALRGATLKVLSDNNACEESWNFVQEAYENCRENHPLCKNSPCPWLPPRLLETHKSGLKLVSGPELPENTQYVALSYCWGTEPFIRLTSNTLEYLEDLISYDDLPAVFRDCVTVAQTLGIDYIWIDALCIQQDSKEDWAFHSARMSLIYEIAELVVGAVTSPNPHAPFLGPGVHNSRTDDSQIREIKPFESVDAPVLLARRFITSSDYAEDALDNNLQLGPNYTAVSGPLDLRAWALQERCLARRSLRYTNGELVWKCRESSRYESLVGYEASALSMSSDLTMTSKEQQQWWYDFVTSYSERNLTFDTDVLAAFSGIVSKLHRPNDRYLAGLWETTLVMDLGWSRKDRFEQPGIERKKRESGHTIASVPTWSWASNSFSVEWSLNFPLLTDEQDDFSPETSTVNIECEPDSVNAWGQVKPGACLTMEGYIIDVRIRTYPSEEGYVYRVYCKDLAPNLLPLASDFWLCRKQAHENEGFARSNTTSPIYCTRAETLPDDEQVRQRDFQLEFSAPALVLGKWNSKNLSNLYYTLLVLEQISSVDSTYQRLGAFSTGAGDKREIQFGDMQRKVIKLI